MKKSAYPTNAARCARVIAVALSAFVLSGCLHQQAPLNPPQLVTARDTDIALQLLMQSSILLGRYYDFDTLEYEDIRDRSVRHGYTALPFMPPIASRATPRFIPSTLPSRNNFNISQKGAAFRAWVNANGGQRMLFAYYISNGWRAAQLICRNYLTGLAEKNDYLEFLQREFNIGATLVNASLIAAGANVTLRAVGVATQWVGNEAIDSYQDFRYLPIDRDVARSLVEAAQNQIAQAYLTETELSKIANARPDEFFFPADSTISFSTAVQAIGFIEYQCTRTGIRGLVNKAGIFKASKKDGKMFFDTGSGQIQFGTPPAPSSPAAPAKGGPAAGSVNSIRQ